MNEEELHREIVSGAFSMQVSDCERNIRIQFEKLQQENNQLKDRINKAIEYIENYMPYVVETDKEYEDVNGHTYFTYKEYTGEEIIKILKGE